MKFCPALSDFLMLPQPREGKIYSHDCCVLTELKPNTVEEKRSTSNFSLQSCFQQSSYLNHMERKVKWADDFALAGMFETESFKKC